jgi:hypothetical protein
MTRQLADPGMNQHLQHYDGASRRVIDEINVINIPPAVLDLVGCPLRIKPASLPLGSSRPAEAGSHYFTGSFRGHSKYSAPSF